jgi:hypothetical protein
VGNGDNSDKKNADKPETVPKVNGSGKEKNGNNGKGPDKGGNSDGAKNAGKKDKAGTDSPGGSGNKQAGTDNGSGKKKPDA